MTDTEIPADTVEALILEMKALSDEGAYILLNDVQIKAILPLLSAHIRATPPASSNDDGLVSRIAEALFLREMSPFIENGTAAVVTFAECEVEYPEVASRLRLEAKTAITAIARQAAAPGGVVERLREAGPRDCMWRSGHDGEGPDPSRFFCDVIGPPPSCHLYRAVADTEGEARAIAFRKADLSFALASKIANDIILVSQDTESGYQLHGIFSSFSDAADHAAKDEDNEHTPSWMEGQDRQQWVTARTVWVASRQTIRTALSTPSASVERATIERKAAEAIRAAFFTSVSGGKPHRYHLSLAYQSMDEMHAADGAIKAWAKSVLEPAAAIHRLADGEGAE